MHPSCAQETLLCLRILRVRRSLNSVQIQQDQLLLVIKNAFLVLILGFNARSCYLSSSLDLSLSFCLCHSLVPFVRFVFVWLCLFCHHKGSGSHVHFCPRPCSRTFRCIDGPRSLTTDTKDHTQCSPCSHASLWPCSHRMCVFAKRLGSVHKLPHAARHEHLFGRHHINVHFFHLLGPFTTEAWCQIICDNFP